MRRTRLCLRVEDVVSPHILRAWASSTQTLGFKPRHFQEPGEIDVLGIGSHHRQFSRQLANILRNSRLLVVCFAIHDVVP